jgi:ABC-type transport system substrate-binding protein
MRQATASGAPQPSQKRRPASFSVPQAEGKFQMLSYTITAAPDAVVEFVSQYYTNGSRNYGHFSDKGLDTLMDKAQIELNKDNRTKLMDEAQQRFMDEWMPMYVLYAGAGKQMVQGNIGGFDQLVGVWWGYRGPGSGQEMRKLYYV